MFGFGKKKKDKAAEIASESEAAIDKPVRQSWLKRLGQGLGRTRTQLGDGLSNLLLGKKSLDGELYTKLETLLLQADVGVNTTEMILDKIQQRLQRREFSDQDAVLQASKQVLAEILEPVDQVLDISGNSPFVTLVVGVNGAGKTTSIAKLAHNFKQHNNKVMLAAGDTFRAAAIEQLQIWGERNNVPVVAQQPGSDSASVIFDAIESAQAKNIDLLLADTAGRLHTQHNLMEELKKIKRVAGKCYPSAPHETLLVLDASQGQNALQQARQFNADLGITGICLTKLDGTSRGGIIFAIAEELKIPIRFIGVGESAEDLQVFRRDDFIAALFAAD